MSHVIVVIQVTACLNAYLELRPCRPRIHKLKELLSDYPYRGPEMEIDYDRSNDADVEEKSSNRRKGPRKVRYNKL